MYQSATPVRRDDSAAAAASSSEAASLGGQPAKTPIIAGSVCGGVLFIAWVVGFAIYFRKRQKRKERKRLAEVGLAEPPPEKIAPSRKESERVVIPPDPAVLLGYAKPGEIAHPAASRHNSSSHHQGEHANAKRPAHHSHSRSHSHVRSHAAREGGRSDSSTSKKRSRSMEQIPVVSRPLPLKSHSHRHKKSHSSSSNSHGRASSSPRRALTDDEMTVPLNSQGGP